MVRPPAPPAQGCLQFTSGSTDPIPILRQDPPNFCPHSVPECQALTVTSALMLQKQLRLDMVHFPTALLLSLSWPPTNDAIVLPTAQANCHRLNVCISPKLIC